MTTFALTRRLVAQIPSLGLMGLRSANEIFRANALGRQISRAYQVKKLDYTHALRNEMIASKF